MDGMQKKKLTQKERNEDVTKGYLEDQGYATKEYVHDSFEVMDARMESRFEVIDQKFDAVDRKFDAIDRRFDALDQKLELFREESYRHMVSLMEDNRHQIRILMEGNNMRFERIERHVGLEPWVA